MFYRILKFLIAPLLSLQIQFAHASDLKIFVVQNEKNVHRVQTREELKKIYLGEKSFWQSGQRIRLYMLSLSSDFMKSVAVNLFSLTPQEFNAHWRRKLFSGNGYPPKELSENQILSQVREEEFAISMLPTKPTSHQNLIIIEL